MSEMITKSQVKIRIYPDEDGWALTLISNPDTNPRHIATIGLDKEEIDWLIKILKSKKS